MVYHDISIWYHHYILYSRHSTLFVNGNHLVLNCECFCSCTEAGYVSSRYIWNARHLEELTCYLCGSLENTVTSISSFSSTMTLSLIFKIFIKPLSNFLSSQAGASSLTMNQERAVSCYFPRCTWRHVRDRCRGSGPQWSWRRALLGEAVTDSLTLNDPYRSSAVWLTAIYSTARFLISLGSL